MPKTRKKVFVKKYTPSKSGPQSGPQGGILPSAYADSGPTPTAPGQFNPVGWNKQHDYGTPQVKKAEVFDQGSGPSPWESPFTRGPQTAGAVSTQGPTGGPAISHGHTSAHGHTRADKGTWYATNAQGKTWKHTAPLTLEARQHYAEQGVKISSRPPGQAAQQDLSDRFGITTFTKWGDVSTTQKNPFKQEQQGLSDKFGITTYNVDGSVSTNPNPNNPKTLHTVNKKPWWDPW